MIDVVRDGTRLTVRVSTASPISGNAFPCTFDTGSEWAANLLVDHIRKILWDRLREIREEAYAEGWKHAKAHKAKQTWQSSRW